MISLRQILIIFTLVSQIQINAQTKTLGLLKKTNGNDENGYILFSPIGSDSTFLLNKCGQMVHFWKNKYTPGMSLYIKPNGNLIKAGVYSDTSFGSAGGKGGVIEEYDWSGNLLWEYTLINDSISQHHDIKPLPNGNVLVLVWHAISKTKAINLGRDSVYFGAYNQLWGEKIIELRPIGTDSAEIVWEWELFDHVIQDVDPLKPNYGVIRDHPEKMNINYALNVYTHDWIHANSIDYNEITDQIAISAHNISEFWIIDHSTTTAQAKTSSGGNSNMGGDILYRWGNPQAYNSGTAIDRKLYRQHNVQWIKNGLQDSGKILLFNNGWDRDSAYSSIDVIDIPDLTNNVYKNTIPYGPSNLHWKYYSKNQGEFYSPIISGAQRLPNGNTLICSGVQGRFFEVTPSKNIVWTYKNPVINSTRLTDGDAPMNGMVFRCEYYPKNYAAFNNKNLSPKGTLEKNSIPYSCTYESNKPILVNLTPAKNATNIMPTNIISLEFNEAVLKRNSGMIRVYNDLGLLEYMDITNDRVSISNKKVFIQLVNTLTSNSKISVEIDANSFRDSSFNLYDTKINVTDWFFYTADLSPKVLSLTPSHNQIGVKLNPEFKVKYNKSIYKNKAGNITLKSEGNTIEVLSINSNNVSIQDSTLIFNFSSTLQPATIYSVVLDTVISDINHYRNNPILNGDWVFQTKESPKFITQSPMHESTYVSRNAEIKFEFDKQVSLQNTASIKLFENGLLKENISSTSSNIIQAGNEFTITPSQAFSPGAWVSISINNQSFKDTSNMYYVGNDSSEWSFSVINNSSVNWIKNSGQISVYPNPANHEINIIGKVNDIEIVNSLGQRFKMKAEENGKYDLTDFENGIYLFIINKEAKIKVIKS